MRFLSSMGLSFGLTSGVITTLGMIVGLNASTHSETAVIGGILTIAIADSFSDALGMHNAEESIKGVSSRFKWSATISTFIFKFLFASSFVALFLIFPYTHAVIASVIWALLVITVFSYFLAKRRGEDAGRCILRHLLVSVLVVLVTQMLGKLISNIFVKS